MVGLVGSDRVGLYGATLGLGWVGLGRVVRAVWSGWVWMQPLKGGTHGEGQFLDRVFER